MEIEIGRGKKARRAYGFDDVAIVPSRRTRDPDDVDISWKLGDYRFELPLLASAMDGVVSPTTAGIIGKLGGLAVLNLEGIWSRFADAEERLEAIAAAPGRLEALHFGVADYAASNRARTVSIGGLNPNYPGDQWHFALSRLIVACRAYGLRPIDGPFGDYSDPDGFRASARRMRRRANPQVVSARRTTRPKETR